MFIVKSKQIITRFIFFIVYFAFINGIIILFSSLQAQHKVNNLDKDSNNYVINNKLVIPAFPEKLDFCGEPVPLDIPEVRERAEREFYLLLQQPGQLCLYLKRAGKYFPIYEKIIAENKLPSDLKFLSVAESALFFSRSSKDALGLWQFMKGTAKLYGLIVNDFVDERCNIVKSTEAALKYLKNAKENLGSWTLAAEGYNMGVVGVKNAMTLQGVNNYYDLYLNVETSRFIFRIVMIKEFMNNAFKYGLNFSKEELYSLGDNDTLKVKGPIENLIIWSRKNDYLYKDIKLLNPWVLNTKLPDGDWELLVPKKQLKE